MTQSKEQAWSLLDPRPVPYYDPQYDQWFVWWNGIHMTSTHALMMASTLFWNSPPTPEMHVTADKQFKFLYAAGAFGHRNWDAQLNSYNRMCNNYAYLLAGHFNTHLKDTDPAEVFSWFEKIYR